MQRESERERERCKTKGVRGGYHGEAVIIFRLNFNGLKRKEKENAPTFGVICAHTYRRIPTTTLVTGYTAASVCMPTRTSMLADLLLLKVLILFRNVNVLSAPAAAAADDDDAVVRDEMCAIVVQ